MAAGRGTLVVAPRFGPTVVLVGDVTVDAGRADVCEPGWEQAAKAINAQAESWLRDGLTVRTLEGLETRDNG